MMDHMAFQEPEHHGSGRTAKLLHGETCLGSTGRLVDQGILTDTDLTYVRIVVPGENMRLATQKLWQHDSSFYDEDQGSDMYDTNNRVLHLKNAAQISS